MKDTGRSRLEQLLDLLADEVAERLRARPTPPLPAKPEPPSPDVPQRVAAEATLEVPPAPASEPAAEIAPALETSHAASLMARLALGVLIVVVLINIPLNTRGTALARSIPSSASLVIMNGLVVKESTSPDIWVYRDDAFHWITSLEAFDHYGYRWEVVHIVEPGFLDQFPKGNPIYVLLKCDSSPHIYRLEA